MSSGEGRSDFWVIKEVRGDYIVLPKEKLYCPICASPLIIHDFSCYRSVWGFYYCDVHMKCINCRLYLTFGIPVNEEEFMKLRTSRYHGKILTNELRDILPPEEAKTIEERLKKWGYW